MFRRKKTNRNSLYISFFNDRGQLENEYIPLRTNSLRKWIALKRMSLYLKIGIEEYYSNYRYLLTPDLLKSEDLLFIMHVLEQHNGSPKNRRESWLYNKLKFLYGSEVEVFIKPLIDSRSASEAIIHPYAQAYYKRWLTKQNVGMKRLYHGVNAIESYEVLDAINEKVRILNKNQQSRQRYHDKKLKQKTAND